MGLGIVVDSEWKIQMRVKLENDVSHWRGVISTGSSLPTRWSVCVCVDTT